MIYNAEFTIDNSGISESIEFIENTLTKLKVKKRDLLDALLISEEILMSMRKNAPEDAKATITVKSTFGVTYVKFIVPGTIMQFNKCITPVSVDDLDEDAEETIRNTILRSFKDSIKYKYSKKKNIVTLITGIPERVLARNTLAAVLGAVILGITMRMLCPEHIMLWISQHVLIYIEEIFISILMCITAPAVFISIICSILRFEGFFQLGSERKAVVKTYLVTAIISILMAMGIFKVLQPGSLGIMVNVFPIELTENLSFMEMFQKIFPSNMVDPFIKVDTLQLIIIAIILGIAMNMSGDRALNTKIIVEELDVICSKIAALVMQCVPFVAFCSMLNVFLKSRTKMIISTIELILVILVGLVASIGFYLCYVWIFGRMNPFVFLRKCWPYMKKTFWKGSAAAAVPLNLRFCKSKLGISEAMSSFAIPLGATINMDGNAICLTICTFFYAKIGNVSLSIQDTIFLLVMILVLSLGAPIAPGTLILCVVTLLAQLGISIRAISIIIGINFVLELLLAMVNVFGDFATTLVRAKREGLLDLNIYNKK